jgi:hypothetical protein
VTGSVEAAWAVDPAISSSAYRWLYRLVEHRYRQQVP